MPLVDKWFPFKTDPSEWKDALSIYYSTCLAYHQMTGAENKATHPQVQILQCLVEKNGNYLEAGCGTGSVCKILPSDVCITGVDFSSIALEVALSGAPDNCTFVRAGIEKLPFPTETFDGVYSFEVLEHIIDPEMAIQQMVRVLKPGGFLLLSMPNRFSLDLHIRKKRFPRFCDIIFACARLMRNRFRKKIYRNIKPDLIQQPYPDCDMIAAVFPDRLPGFLRSIDCDVKFCDTYYMRAHAEHSDTDLNFQKKTNHWFYGYFGDHILLLAFKESKN